MEAKKKTTQTKHEDIFAFYEELIKQEGERAKCFTKSYFYQIVGDKFYISADHAAKIITKALNVNGCN